MNDIFSLIDAAKKHLSKIGLADSTIKTYQQRSFNQIIRRYEKEGDYTYQQYIMDELLADAEQQYIDGTISRKSRNWRCRGIKIIQELYETGSYQWKVFQTKDSCPVPAAFADTIAEFMGSFSRSKHYTAEIKNIIVRYAVFLEMRGIDAFPNAKAEHMRDFLASMSVSRPKSMDKVVLSIRKLYSYLSMKGMTCNSLWILLSSPRSRDHSVKPAIPQKEIVRLADQIDLGKSPGKRDYAILVLAMTSGLRAGDISSLKLTDIFWKQGEIRITQGKTGHTLTLPLQETARDALADYILNERPKSEEKCVFLRACAPYTAFYDGVSVACIFRRYLEKAGIRHQSNDGRTFHGIRRALGTAMVAGGTPVTTVSQVLGHQSIRTTRQYIAMDLEGLRRCALPLSSLGGGA